MIGLETNILVRYLAQDDEKQSAIVTKLIEGNLDKSTDKSLDKNNDKEGYYFINHIVLCELVWVLQCAYKVQKKQIVEIIEQLLQTSQFTCQSPDIIWKALKNYKNGTADFADYMTSAININQGCKYTLSFDKKALKSGDFVSPKETG